MVIYGIVPALRQFGGHPTELQVICLFRSSPVNSLHGSLTEINEKLKGLLERVRQTGVVPWRTGRDAPARAPERQAWREKVADHRAGDSQSFSPQRMQLVGEILYMEPAALGWRTHSSPRPYSIALAVASRRVFPYLEDMEVRLAPDVEKKLNDLATRSGRGTDELLQDALAGYFDEVAQTRDMLNSRYDDLKSGRVKPIPGDEVVAYFREKSAAARRTPPGS